jgi:hypothetical protein
MVSLEFYIDNPFRPHYDPGLYSGSNKNDNQEYLLGGKGGRCVGLTTLPPSCADCLEIWEPQPPGTLRAVQACNEITLTVPLPLLIYVIQLLISYLLFIVVHMFIVINLM